MCEIGYVKFCEYALFPAKNNPNSAKSNRIFPGKGRGDNCVKIVCIRNYSGPHFPAFGLSTKCLSVFSPNARKCGLE